MSTPNPFDNVWFWGNPIIKPPKSYASALIGDTYGNLRLVTSSNFGRLLPLWARALLEVQSDEVELLKAKLYEQEARSYGVPRIQEYIADKLGTSQQRVSRLLLLISIANMDEQLTDFGYDYVTSPSISESGIDSWYPSRKKIKAMMATMQKPCAATLSNCYDLCFPQKRFSSKLPICPACHRELANDNSITPFWVLAEVTRIETQHRKEAIELCFKERYGTISIDEADSYLDAA